ncbi:MAG: hypothetical protein ACK4K9_11165 [Bacteroidia bacterium]
MKKSVFIGLISIFFIAEACKKENNNNSGNNNNNTNPTDTSKPNPNLPPYYITANINGSPLVLKATSFVKDYPANVQEVYMSGFMDYPNKLPAFQFVFKKPSAGFYDGLSYVLDENDRQNFVNFTNLGQQIFKSTATPKGDSSGVRIFFTKFPFDSGSAVEGRFSGTLQLEESEQTVTIRDGKFKIQVFN